MAFIGANLALRLISTEDATATDVLLRGWLIYAFFVSMYAVAMTYVSLALIKLYIVARPLQVRSTITLRRCVAVVVANWCIPAIAVPLIVIIGANWWRDGGAVSSRPGTLHAMAGILLALHAQTVGLYIVTSKLSYYPT